MTEEEITRVLADMGQPAFRGKQVFTWLHRGVRSFDEMSNLSKPLRQQLAQAYTISVPTVARKQESRLDGTTAIPCASPPRWAAAWAAPSAPAPWPERSGT